MKRKHTVSIIVTVVLLMTLFATIASANLAEVFAQGPTPSLTPWAYLPYISRQGSSTPEPTDCTFYEPNDTPEQANWIQSGETQIHCIMPKTDTDWVKFSVNTESQVVIETSGESEGDAELRLYDSNQDQLEVDIEFGVGFSSRIDRACGNGQDPLAAGLYYASVEEWLNNTEIPRYDITLTVNGCPTPAILTNHSYHATTFGSLIIVGEVQNIGELSVRGVNVVANLFNNSDQLIDTGKDTAELSVLPPGEKTCFMIGLSEFEGWSYYEFETPTYYSANDNQLQNLTVYNDNGTYDPDDGSYRILGFVRNDNNIRIEYVQPIATLYDASGTVVGCSYTYVNSTHLNPGQSSSFELTFSAYYGDYADVASYRIQVDGNFP
jgi:hypothetical protein